VFGGIGHAPFSHAERSISWVEPRRIGRVRHFTSAGDAGSGDGGARRGRPPRGSWRAGWGRWRRSSSHRRRWGVRRCRLRGEWRRCTTQSGGTRRGAVHAAHMAREGVEGSAHGDEGIVERDGERPVPHGVPRGPLDGHADHLDEAVKACSASVCWSGQARWWPLALGLGLDDGRPLRRLVYRLVPGPGS